MSILWLFSSWKKKKDFHSYQMELRNVYTEGTDRTTRSIFITSIHAMGIWGLFLSSMQHVLYQCVEQCQIILFIKFNMTDLTKQMLTNLINGMLLNLPNTKLNLIRVFLRIYILYCSVRAEFHVNIFVTTLKKFWIPLEIPETIRNMIGNVIFF